MWASDPHVPVVIHYSDKGLKFFSILRLSDFHNRFYLFVNRFVSWSRLSSSLDILAANAWRMTWLRWPQVLLHAVFRERVLVSRDGPHGNLLLNIVDHLCKFKWILILPLVCTFSLGKYLDCYTSPSGLLGIHTCRMLNGSTIAHSSFELGSNLIW